MAKARNRNLAGLAGLAALGAMMARTGKQEGSNVPVEDRGLRGVGMDQSAESEYVGQARGVGMGQSAESEYAGRPSTRINTDSGDLYTPLGAETPSRPAAATRQMPAASRPAPVSYSAAEAATDLARESTRGVKPATATPAASAASSRGLMLGTPTRPAPGVPSIYAGPEAWAEYRRRQAAGMKKGGTVKKMASGGSVSSASKRGDGIAQRGKTRGRIV